MKRLSDKFILNLITVWRAEISDIEECFMIFRVARLMILGQRSAQILETSANAIYFSIYSVSTLLILCESVMLYFRESVMPFYSNLKIIESDLKRLYCNKNIGAYIEPK